jgi:quercetin dioxygenase-like cupin family protein
MQSSTCWIQKYFPTLKVEYQPMIPDKTTLDTAAIIQASLKAYKMHQSAGLEIVHLHLLPGESIPLHSNPVDVIFCILEGSGSLDLSDEIITLEKFDVIHIPAGMDRGMNNIGSLDLRLLVIKKINS